MAKFKEELPNDLIKQFEELGINSEKMVGEMTKAGADAVFDTVIKHVPASFIDSDIMNCLKVTRTYKTPSDDGINNYVGFYGYFINKKGEKVPAPLVCNVFEYGRKKLRKKPFFRQSFKKSMIEKVMIDVQDKYLKGDF